MIGVQCQLVICRGHIRASKGRLFQIFLWLTVLWQIDILVQFYTLVFISSQIWKGCKWVRRSKILSGLNLNGSNGIQCKNRKNFYWRVTGALFQVNNIKVPFGITHPQLHIKPSLYMCKRLQGFQIFKQNWIISIHLRVIVILLIWVSSALGVGQVDGECPEWLTIVYMSSGMYRGKESSNRIELSWLVQELLNFGDLGCLQLWGWGMGGWRVDGGWQYPPYMYTHTHTHACTHMHMQHGKHDNFMQMAGLRL